MAPCVFLCDYRAQLSMGRLWPGLSLFICSMSRRAPSLPSGRLWKHAPGCFCAPALASASLALPHTSAGRRERASSFLGSVRVFVSPSTCELRVCVSQSLGAGGCQGPCLAAPSAGPNLGPAVARARPLAALGRGSVRAARAGPGETRCSPARRPLPGSLARWLSRSLARPLRSGSAEGGGVGCWGGGRGGSCILAVGEESEPALLVSRRAQLQPRGPARPLAARPGLLGWARARPRAGDGASPLPAAPFPPGRPGAGLSSGGGAPGGPPPPG